VSNAAAVFLAGSLIAYLGAAVIIGAVADRKGRSFNNWFWFGLALPPFAALAAALIEPTEIVKRQQLLEQGYDSCPLCYEIIRPEAVVCPHCGRDIPEDRPEPEWSPDDETWDQAPSNEGRDERHASD